MTRFGSNLPHPLGTLPTLAVDGMIVCPFKHGWDKEQTVEVFASLAESIQDAIAEEAAQPQPEMKRQTLNDGKTDDQCINRGHRNAAGAILGVPKWQERAIRLVVIQLAVNPRLGLEQIAPRSHTRSPY